MSEKINNYAYFVPFDEDADINELPSLVYRLSEETPGCVIMGETVELDGYPYVVTEPIEFLDSNSAREEDSSRVWDLGSKSQAYKDFLFALENDLSILNVPFNVVIERCNTGMAPPYISVYDPHKQAQADKKWLKFNMVHIVGQSGNWLLNNFGDVGFVNWLALMPESENLLRRLGRENKYFRYGGSDCLKDEWVPIMPYPFIADEQGWTLNCKQYNSLAELQEVAETLTGELAEEEED